MKLLIVVATVLCLSTASGTFFKKKAKYVDLHITKGSPPIQAAPGQVPVGQGPFISFLPQGHSLIEGQFLPVNHVQLGQVHVGQVPAHKAPVGKVQGPLSVPVFSQHSVQIVPVHVEAPYLQPQLVSVEPSVSAIQLLFKTASSPLLVKQKHFASPGAVYQATQSADYPHVLRHVVHKPVLQEVREVIQPYRTITTQIQPVQERVHTILPVQKYGPGGVGSPSQVHFNDQYRQDILQGPIRFSRPEKGPAPQEPIEQQQQEIEQEPEPPTEQHPVKGIV
ncbi:hypothetical protein TYRP_000392 [Tyrophagus putrescentiae]|nr:hypothetical protein TYRP_000392 [Tyrophagus putrescentiae]